MNTEFYNPDNKFVGKISNPPNGNIAERLKEYAESTGQDYAEMLAKRGLSPDHIGNCLVTGIIGSFPEIHEKWLLFGTCPTMDEILQGPSETSKNHSSKGPYTAISKSESIRFIKRLEEFATEQGITLWRIAKESGISETILYNARAGRFRISKQTVQKILTRYPALKKDNKS